MADPTQLTGIDLSPIPGKTYFSIDREWREEFLSFLMVDRFSDGVDRPVTSGTGRSAGVHTPDGFYGGDGEATVQRAANGTHFVRLDLAPHQFVVLR